MKKQLLFMVISLASILLCACAARPKSGTEEALLSEEITSGSLEGTSESSEDVSGSSEGTPEGSDCVSESSEGTPESSEGVSGSSEGTPEGSDCVSESSEDTSEIPESTSESNPQSSAASAWEEPPNSPTESADVSEAPSAPPITASAGEMADTDLEDWKHAYLEYLEKLYLDAPQYAAGFIYVDDDDLPELAIDIGVSAASVILTYYDHAVDELYTDRSVFTYIERGNLLCNSDGIYGRYHDYVYTIKDGKWEYVAGGEYGDGPDGIQFDENGNWIVIYHWNGKEVGEEEYAESLNAVYPMERAIDPNRRAYYTLSEVQSLLMTAHPLDIP